MSTDYAALADSIKIEDITSNTHNKSILQRLKDNDNSFDKLTIRHRINVTYGLIDPKSYATFDDDGDSVMGWLGYFVGQNTKLQVLQVYETIDDESFYKEMSCNTSIKNVHFNDIGLLEGRVISLLRPFFTNNYSLVEIKMEYCSLDEADVRQLSLAIEACSKSLKTFDYTNNYNGAGNIFDIITALSMHPQLEKLRLCGNNIGRNEYTALSTLLHCTTAQLQELILYNNDIDDEGVDMIVQAFSHENKLKELNLGTNQSITIKGWKRLSTLLETPGCSLENLCIYHNYIGDEGALIFAKALANNSTLKALRLDAEGSITTEGWAPFLKLLCDTSSVNSTYLSNHTLETISDIPRRYKQLLGLNSSSYHKQYTAMVKILQNHSHFSMEPFFEWEVKVLPIMVSWFAKAGIVNNYSITFNNSLRRMKLDCIYDFIKEFPMLYIEPVTRQEIAECIAWEERLQWLGREDKLEEIRQRKARALRRL